METPSLRYQTDSRDGWPIWLFASLLGYACFLFLPQVFNDGDTYLHVAVGQWILLHKIIPHTDPFSYTFAGAPWVAHEWLSEILMALAFQWGGWNGIVILFGAATALTLGMMAFHLARWLDPLPVLVTLSIIIASVSPVLLARPHILVLPVMEMWMAGIVIARSRAQAPSMFLVLLMVLWANLHGSFITGILLIGPFALEAMAAAGKEWRKALYSWGLFSAGAVIAAMITPQGWHGLLFPFQLMALKHLNAISEWRSTDFQTIQPIELALVAVLYVCLSRGIKLPTIRLLVLIGLLHLGLQHTRLQMQAGIFGALILAQPLGAALGAARTIATDNPTAKIPHTFLRITCFLVMAFMLTAARIKYPIPIKLNDGITAPVSAIDHVPERLLSERVLNEDAFGSYMLFRGIHPFLDGRMDLYGNAFMGEYLKMMSPDRELLEKTLKTYDVKWIIMATKTPIIAVLDMLPGWHRIYADKIAVVYIRNDSP